MTDPPRHVTPPPPPPFDRLGSARVSEHKRTGSQAALLDERSTLSLASCTVDLLCLTLAPPPPPLPSARPVPSLLSPGPIRAPTGTIQAEDPTDGRRRRRQERRLGVSFPPLPLFEPQATVLPASSTAPFPASPLPHASTAPFPARPPPLPSRLFLSPAP